MKTDDTSRQMTIVQFMLRAAGIAMTPLVLLVIIYILSDPYYILDSRTTLEVVSNSPGARLSVNKGVLSLNALQRRVEAGDTPDSFIFGASISCYYETDYWRKYIDTNTMPLHFDSASEGATSLRKKIEYLKRNNIPIKNALIIIDPNTIEKPLEGNDIASIDHPDIAGWWTWPKWYYTFISTFYDHEFMTSYIPFSLTGRPINYGHKEIFERQPMSYDSYRNEESIPLWDAEIAYNPLAFQTYSKFPIERQLHCSNSERIDTEREKEYRRIAELLSSTDYHVIVSPTLTGDTLSERDDTLLRSIFGDSRYHNLTVSMHNIALNDTNWYDTIHYRAQAARTMLDEVYKNQ